MAYKLIVHKGLYSILNTRKQLKGAFTSIDDGKEKTSIIEESRIKDKKSVIKAENGFKLITFDMVFPFTTVSFLAKVSKALADEKIPIFCISAYSTDHLLLKEKHLKKALTALRRIK